MSGPRPLRDVGYEALPSLGDPPFLEHNLDRRSNHENVNGVHIRTLRQDGREVQAAGARAT